MDTKKAFSLISFSILIESTITYFNQFVVQGVFVWQMCLSIVFGIFIAIAYELNLLKYFDISSKIPYVDLIITGILISRGSNYVYDLISKLGSI